MRTNTRTVAPVVGLAVAAYAGLVLACPEWAHSNGLDFWVGAPECAAAAAAPAQLHDSGEAAALRARLKHRLTEELIAGRITYGEAIEHFLAINRSADGVMATTRGFFPAATDEESVARQVLSYVDAHLRRDPARQVAVKDRLSAERRGSRAAPAVAAD